MKRAALTIIGVLLAASGALFMAQGSGLVHWPQESFMVDQSDWIYKGAVVLVAGIAALFLARRA